MAAEDDRILVITRVFDAPRELVFKAWTEPERLMQWWGSRGYTTPWCQMEVRPGGAFRICMRSPEGAEYWVRGVYREVVEPVRIVMSGAWEEADGKLGHETMTTVTFEERDGKTILTLRNGVFETVAQRDSHRGGWSSSIERLAELLSRDKSNSTESTNAEDMER